MGLFRKATSVSTLGLVDFRSAKDRTASNTHKAAKQAKKQTHIMQQQLRAQQQQRPTVLQGAGVIPGWYPCPSDAPGTVRLWDGSQWTASVRNGA